MIFVNVEQNKASLQALQGILVSKLSLSNVVYTTTDPNFPKGDNVR
ncbi:hypothetical protein [Helicobacter cetorum]|nr:hypothetical protein [Helicobacter cetorum]